MRYAKVRSQDISNGPGFRVSLFTQGCQHHCEGCFNKETWDEHGGYEWTLEKEDKLLDLCDKDYIQGLSILGGEPLLELYDGSGTNWILHLVAEFKFRFPEKDIWLWTGYTWETLKKYPNKKFLCMLEYIDVIVDGPFIQSQKELGLKYRGSKNQRVIDVQKTLKDPFLRIVPYSES